MGIIIGCILFYTELRLEGSDKREASGMDIEEGKDQMSAEANRRTLVVWAWLVGILGTSGSKYGLVDEFYP